MENKVADIHFLEIPEQLEYVNLINDILKEAFKEEGLDKIKMYINIILTNPSTIKATNKIYRNIDQETDVLSFPMFEKDELEKIISSKSELPIKEVLGDVMISIQRVKEQAEEYGHSFERELSYMLIHGFYHLMGYDHIKEIDKKEMRAKEEKILERLNITRN